MWNAWNPNHIYRLAVSAALHCYDLDFFGAARVVVNWNVHKKNMRICKCQTRAKKLVCETYNYMTLFWIVHLKKPVIKQ